MFAISGQRDPETSRGASEARVIRLVSRSFPFLAYPPVIACRRLILNVAERVSSVAELTRTSILDNSMSA